MIWGNTSQKRLSYWVIQSGSNTDPAVTKLCVDFFVSLLGLYTHLQSVIFETENKEWNLLL